MQTIQYFSDCQTVQDVKNTWRKLCMIHHPDRGGDTLTMQIINEQYHIALESMAGQTTRGSDGKDHKYYYSRKQEQEIMDKVQEIAAAGMIGIEILLIGSWIWITGNTRQYRKILGKEGLKCRWHSKRLCWYWHKPGYKSKYNSHVDLAGLAATYGCTEFDSEERTQINH